MGWTTARFPLEPNLVAVVDAAQVRSLIEFDSGHAQAAVLEQFVRAGYVRIETPVLHDIATFLDLGGEEVRAELCTTNDGTRELCLRPEYTIPACKKYLSFAGDGATSDYSYCGSVFRLRREEPRETVQAGLESFGRLDKAAADAEILGLTVAGIRAASPIVPEIVMGDVGLVERFLEACGLPELRRRRLRRGLAKGDPIDAILEGAFSFSLDGRPGLMAAAKGSELKDVQALVEAMLSVTGIANLGGRSTSEIAERIFRQAEPQATLNFSEEERQMLVRFMQIAGAPDDVSRTLRSFCREFPLGLERELDLFDERIGCIAACGIHSTKTSFRMSFGRNLEYYTGFVFEARSEGAIIAGGGRYDRLSQILGSREPVPAVGACIWLDRLRTLATTTPD